MTDDHEDYETGAAPAAHKVSHQDGGTDEISVAGLSGETAELSAHKILPSIHHVKFTAAEARASISNVFGSDGKADSDIDLDTHGLINVADAVNDQDAITLLQGVNAIAAHAGLPTVHQDAPQLILDHKGDAAAHHAKYTDAEARAVHSPISVSPAAFFPFNDTYNWYMAGGELRNATNLAQQVFSCGLIFDPGITITKLYLYGMVSDALATLYVDLRRVDRLGNTTVMAALTNDWSDGYGNMSTETIGNATIDNVNYMYSLEVHIDPNDDAAEVKFTGSKIEFTG